MQCFGTYHPDLIPNDITDVGILSPYGTAGQGGNVDEWEETDADLVNDFAFSDRGVRGGNWIFFSDLLLSSFRDSWSPTTVGSNIGFRVASLPEPAGLAGDFNDDGRVNGFDFLAWQRDPNVGTLADWEANYGMPLAVNNATVPEPAIGAILLPVLFVIVKRSRSCH